MQTSRDPIHDLEFLCIEIARRLRNVYGERLRVTGLQESWIGALVYLERIQPVTQIELARRIGIGRAAMGSLIESLHRAGLVTRVRTTQDRRVWLVSLTEAGRAAVVEVDRLGAELGRELRGGLSRHQRGEVVAVLGQFRTNLIAMANRGDGWARPTNGESTAGRDDCDMPTAERS